LLKIGGADCDAKDVVSHLSKTLESTGSTLLGKKSSLKHDPSQTRLTEYYI